MPSFSERLLKLRKERHISQAALAKALGIDVRTYQRYEAGEREAAITTLSHMADFYHVTIDYLVGRSDA